MKRLLFFSFLLAMFIGSPLTVSADQIISKLDSLHDEKTLVNYENSIVICEKALQNQPDNYDLYWRCARSYRWFGELSKRAEIKDWKKICATYGKKGMNYAQRATELKADLPNGYYWYGLNVGIYSDGVSIFKALKEGLKNKTQNSFEKVYNLDKNHEKAGAILSLGRFWAVLPWPMKKKKLSLKYYREYQQTEYFGKGLIIEGPLYLAELLIDLGGKKNKAEAKELLNNIKTENMYYLSMIQNLLAKTD